VRGAGTDVATIGQYLQPKREKLDVVEDVHPDVFEEYRVLGEGMGFRAVFSCPFVRSLYMADEVAAASSRA
jgi:lipoic acid synthetase